MWLIAGKFAVVLPIVAFILNIFVGAYVYAQKQRTRVHQTFLLFIVNSTGWLGFEFLMYFPLSKGFETEIWRWTSIFWIYAGVLYLEFANAVAGKQRNFLSYIGFIAATVGYGITGFTDIVFQDVTIYDWGTAPVGDPVAHTIVSANTALFTFFGMVVMTRQAYRSDDVVQKKIICLLLFGTVVAAIAIAVVNVALPNFFGICHLPRYGASAMSVFLVVVFYAIEKYQFLAMSPHEVAEELYENVQVGILLLDADGNVLRVNREATRLLGRISPGTDSRRLLKGCDLSGEFTGRELFWRTEGDTRQLTLSASAVVHGGRHLGTILMVQDITDQKQAEEVLRKSRDELEREVQLRTAQLRRAQRMETIGTLAGGIAHDFNNSLAVILGFSKAALMDLPEDSAIREDINEVLLAANRGKDMVNQILMLARKENRSDHSQVNMAALLAETINQLQVNTPDNIRVHVDIRLEKPFVSGAPTQLSQVIANLYTNACHAIMNRPDGSITVSLKNIQLRERTEYGGVLVGPGNYVVLQLTDTGCGISEADLPHVFDPFFTTKARDEGTGLGLASAQVIIHNHDGEISVESKLGEGTTFVIYLPVLEYIAPLESVAPGRISDHGQSAAGEEILWVDDKRQILKMGQRILTPLGYRVSTANGGEEALRLFEASPEGFCLVITDYSMPRMTGIELADELRKRQPDIPIIMLSGYGEAISKDELAASGISAFLKKPVEAKDLLATMKRVLAPRTK